MAGFEEMIAEGGDGDGVVETEAKGREENLTMLAEGGFGEARAQAGVGGDAPADGDDGTVETARSAQGLLDENVDDGFLEGGDDVGQLLRGEGPPSLSPDKSGASFGGSAHPGSSRVGPSGILAATMVENGGFEAREGEVERVAADE